MSLYYLYKYAFNYPFHTPDGKSALMFTIPMPEQIKMYQSRIGQMPRSYFDCGAAIGFMVAWGHRMGLDARGIDIKRYPNTHPFAATTDPLFADGHIQIKSILDIDSVTADLAYCNGTLTYMNEMTLPLALARMQNVRMLIAIHNTTEDIALAATMGYPIVYDEPRLVRSNQWWMDMFQQNGFDVDFDMKNGCFCARPQHIR